jgi:adenosine deaminase
VCCDDTLLFDTNLNKEWEIFVREMGLGKKEVERLVKEAV